MKRYTAIEYDPAGRLPILDLLRFLAAIGIMLYHYTYHTSSYLVAAEAERFGALQTFTKHGYLGVVLFFMISGFAALWGAGSRTALDYAISRIARLFPSLWAAIAVTCIVYLGSGQHTVLLQAKVILANMTLAAGFSNLPYIDGVYWTLTPIIKFYFIVLVLIVTRQIKYVKYWLAAWSVGLALTYMIDGPGWLKAIVIYPYGPYFISGSLFYLSWREGPSKYFVISAAVAFILCLTCIIKESPNFLSEGVSFFFPVAEVAAVLLFYTLFTAISFHKIRLPRSACWIILGSVTYPLYLLHNQIGKTIAASVAGTLGASTGIALGIVGSFLLAIILTQTTEKKGCPWLKRILRGTIQRIGIGDK